MKRSRARAALGLGLVLAASFLAACGWNPSKPFERDAPSVKEALGLLDGGDAQTASSLLAEYLTTGPCAEGNIGTPRRLKDRPNATFDLGLALFQVAEGFGGRFGEEEGPARGALPPLPMPPGAGDDKGASAGTVECALKIVRAIADDALQPVDLRARALYLQGNLLFLDGKYKEAVEAYDRALELVPGMSDTGPFSAKDAGARWTVDAIGRDAAWNRAVALRREEEKKDAGPPPDGGGGDGGQNDSPDGGGKNDPDGGKNDKADGGGKNDDANDGKDDKADGGAPPPPKPEGKDGGASKPPPPAPTSTRASQDERMLDQLEAAPTVQQELAKKQQQARGRARVSGMADK